MSFYFFDGTIGQCGCVSLFGIIGLKADITSIGMIPHILLGQVNDGEFQFLGGCALLFLNGLCDIFGRIGSVIFAQIHLLSNILANILTHIMGFVARFIESAILLDN